MNGVANVTGANVYLKDAIIKHNAERGLAKGEGEEKPGLPLCVLEDCLIRNNAENGSAKVDLMGFALGGLGSRTV